VKQQPACLTAIRTVKCCVEAHVLQRTSKLAHVYTTIQARVMHIIECIVQGSTWMRECMPNDQTVVAGTVKENLVDFVVMYLMQLKF